MYAPRRTIVAIVVLLVAFAGVAQAVPTCTVDADAFVLQTDANKSFGTRAILQVDASPMQRAFIRIVVGGVGAGDVVTGVALKLRTSTDDKSDSGGQLHLQPGCGWTETGLTWNHQPAFDAAVLDAKGAVGKDQLVEFDPSPAVVTGNGSFCFVIDSLSSDGIDYYAREASSARRPTCMVQVSAAPTTTTTTSTTSTTSSTNPPVCTPVTCEDVGAACGVIPNGCGGLLQCQPPCITDADCGSQQLCGPSFRCAPRVENARACKREDDCLSGCCCFPITGGTFGILGVCTTATVCRQTPDSNEYFCPGGACSGDGDCHPTSQFCDAQGTCEQKHPRGAECQRAAECGLAANGVPESTCCCAHSLLAPAHCEVDCGADPNVFGQCIQ